MIVWSEWWLNVRYLCSYLNPPLWHWSTLHSLVVGAAVSQWHVSQVCSNVWILLLWEYIKIQQLHNEEKLFITTIINAAFIGTEVSVAVPTFQFRLMKRLQRGERQSWAWKIIHSHTDRLSESHSFKLFITNTEYSQPGLICVNSSAAHST